MMRLFLVLAVVFGYALNVASRQLLGNVDDATYDNNRTRRNSTSSSVISRSNTGINATELDCSFRFLALEYARKIINVENSPLIIFAVKDALRLDELCGTGKDEETIWSPARTIESDLLESYIVNRRLRSLHRRKHRGGRNDDGLTDSTKENGLLCKQSNNINGDNNTTVTCIFVSPTRTDESSLQNGSGKYPWRSIHRALQHARSLTKETENRTNSRIVVKVVLREGVHTLHGETLQLTEMDSGLTITGYPGEDVWISGGLQLEGTSFTPSDRYEGVYIANLTEILDGYTMPQIVSLFTSRRRYIRARYPDSDPEVDQWGYASPQRLKYSLSSDIVLEWQRPPPGERPTFTFIDFATNPPPGVPIKNNSAMRGYNWYASGYGGACSDVWGVDANSYWCSNASQGGWAEVDQECAISGQMQLPIGMTYNQSEPRLRLFQNASLTGGYLFAWHSQSWAMHMFEIASHCKGSSHIRFAKGGGRQGGRNWCRCDQCTYAGHWCGQHQSPSWTDTRLIGGTWMIENVIDFLDQPGEYYFDRETRLLYVKPNMTDDLQDLTVGLLTELISIRDTGNVEISNLGFRDQAPTFMAEDWSAPSGGDWALHRGGAILVENAFNVSIHDCNFFRLDGNAIFLSRRTRMVQIERNHFQWLGENAIATWGDSDDYDATSEDFPMYTLIQGNVMRELGIYQKQSSAVGQCKAALTTIRNNIMFNMPRAAINFNELLGGGDIVEGNLIFNTCRESGDHGPINSWDRQPYLTSLRDANTKSFDPLIRTIRHNFVFANYGASQGVDNDDGSSWFHIHDNVFYSADGFKMDYGGHDSVFENNLVLSYGTYQYTCLCIFA
jgi:hypothetical protein